MGEDYEAIWLEPKCADADREGRTWCSQDDWGKCDECGLPSVKYIRADIARIEGLKEAGTIAAEKACALSEQGEDEESSGASEVWQAIQARISALEDDHE